MAAGLPTAILVEVEFTAGVWTDIATHVVGDSIEIRVGRESAASDVQPGTLSLTLDNADGQWTPDNPTSTRYPNWVEGKRIRVRVTKGTTSTRFVGRITAIVPDFPSEPSQSRVQVTAVDSLGDLALITLRDLPRQKAIAQSLTMYPLDDPDGSTSAASVNGDRAALPVPGGVFADVDTLGYDGLSFLTLPADKTINLYGSGWTTTSFFVRTTNTATPIYYLVPDGSSTVSYVDVQWTGSAFTMRVYGLAGLYDETLTIAASPGGNYVSVFLEVDAGGSPGTSYSLTVNGTTSSSSNGAFPPTTSTPFLARFQPTADIGLAYITASTTLSDVWRTVLIGGESTETFLGTLTTIAKLSTASATLDGTAALSTTLSPIAADGRSALEVVVDMANVEGGYCYHEYSTSATQTVRILDRASSAPSTVSLTVDGELDLNGGPTLVRERLGNPSAVTAKSPAQAVTASTTSVAGGQVDELDGLWDGPVELEAAAERYIARAASQRLRVSQLTFDLSLASNDLYASFFGLYPSRRIRLSNLPPTYFGVTYMDGYVEGWTERPGVTGYEVTFDLSPADAPPEGLWDDSTYGRWGFGDGVATNSSSATDSATSVQFQWTGGLTLSTSAGDYPLDLDWNGERVTVNSAPAGGSSPQTLSITRGVAPTVARAHNAGEPVDIWNAARWAM